MEYLFPGVVGICCLFVGVVIGTVSVKIKNAFSSIRDEIATVSDGIYNNMNDELDGFRRNMETQFEAVHRIISENDNEVYRTIDSRCDSLAHKIKQLEITEKK